MNDAMVTFQGWVGTDVVYRETQRGNVANFRVGVTPRIRQRNGDWVDGQTSWFSVSCWRQLAEHVRDSVHKGDPVLVHGRLRTDVWERTDGQSSVTHVVEAVHVGHDLGRGTSHFTRSLAPARPEEDEAEAMVKELIHDQPEDLPQLDRDGQVRDPGRRHQVA